MKKHTPLQLRARVISWGCGDEVYVLLGFQEVSNQPPGSEKIIENREVRFLRSFFSALHIKLYCEHEGTWYYNCIIAMAKYECLLDDSMSMYCVACTQLGSTPWFWRANLLSCTIGIATETWIGLIMNGLHIISMICLRFHTTCRCYLRLHLLTNTNMYIYICILNNLIYMHVLFETEFFVWYYTPSN